jgi:hypothetical protein
MKRNLIALLFLAGFYTGNAQAIENFSLTNVITGTAVSLDTYPSCLGIVIIFTSNTCAYDEHYRVRMATLAKDYHDKVPVLLVNSSMENLESIENMVRKAQQLGLTVPYLADKDQTLLKSLGATKSPQAFLLKNNGGKFYVVYNGAIDDNPQLQTGVRHAYLKDAIDIMLTNQTFETREVRPVGCSIRKK